MSKKIVLDSSIVEEIKKLSKSGANEKVNDIVPDPLHAVSYMQKALEISKEKEITNFLHKLLRGRELLFEALSPLLDENPELDAEIVVKEFNQIGHTSPDLPFSISDQTIQAFNKIAAFFYENKNYAEAACIYTLLSYLEPQEPAYWLGLGHSEFYTNQFEEAIAAYKTCLEVDNLNPQNHLFLAYAYHALKNDREAFVQLDEASKLIESNADFKNLEEQLAGFKNLINYK